MAETMKRLLTILEEQSWTRVALSQYTLAQLQLVDKVLDEVFVEKAEEEALALALEHDKESKKNIASLYILALVHLQKQSLDDSSLITLLDLLVQNQKWALAEYVCHRALSFGEHKYVLAILARVFEHNGQLEELPDVWHRLVQADFENTEALRKLAAFYEQKGELDAALDFNKKAVYRYINAGQFSGLNEVWKKLIELVSEGDLEFFFSLAEKTAKTFEPKKAVLLLEELCEPFLEKNQWIPAIEIIKYALHLDPKSARLRKEIVRAYKGQHAENPQLQTFLTKSSLVQSWRNVFEAIEDFEKHIFFAPGNFVLHKTWSIGLIRSVQNEQVEIDFVQKRGHKISLSMAVSALQILPKDDIRVYKATWKPERLNTQIKSDIEWALRTVIKSYGSASLKMIKSELVPSILSLQEWTAWSSKARELLQNNPIFSHRQGKSDHYIVRQNPITVEEKLYIKFRSEEDFFTKYKIFGSVLHQLEEPASSEQFREMFLYFTFPLKVMHNVDEITVSSFLLVDRLAKQYPFLATYAPSITFEELFQRIPDVVSVFMRMGPQELRSDFLQKVKAVVPSWKDVYVKIFPFSLTRRIVEALQKEDLAMLKVLYKEIASHPKELREAFIWLMKNRVDFPEACEDLKDETLVMASLSLLTQLNLEIEAKKNTSDNRRYIKNLLVQLFQNNLLRPYLEKASVEFAERVLRILQVTREASAARCLVDLQQWIREIFGANFHFEELNERNKWDVEDNSFLATLHSYSERQREFQQLKDVEIPANSREIGQAMELGDLKENAEYHAAKEKQALLTARLNALSVELENVRIVEFSDIRPDSVGFGVKIVLVNNRSKGKKEHYTILGPWESNPDKGVISYKSPFGSELIEMRVGENRQFRINDRDFDYVLESIELAQF